MPELNLFASSVFDELQQSAKSTAKFVSKNFRHFNQKKRANLSATGPYTFVNSSTAQFGWCSNFVRPRRFFILQKKSIKTYRRRAKSVELCITELVGHILVKLIQSVLFYTGPSLIVLIYQIVFIEVKISCK